ncbi:hypothetical protein B0H13DRAFT_1872888 [Mycena leptocephala]|nr:hypothetical protein B0H13DRAFT_1872888 [Mycena leptocephala]
MEGQGMGRGGMEGAQHGGAGGAPEVHSELELQELGRACGVRSMDVCRGSAHASRHRSHGPAEAWRRDRARSTRARLRGRGSKSADNAEDWHLVECQWKIQGDTRAGRRHKSESVGAQGIQWSRSAECGRQGSVSASAGRWETASGPIAIEN